VHVSLTLASQSQSVTAPSPPHLTSLQPVEVESTVACSSCSSNIPSTAQHINHINHIKGNIPDGSTTDPQSRATTRLSLIHPSTAPAIEHASGCRPLRSPNSTPLPCFQPPRQGSRRTQKKSNLVPCSCCPLLPRSSKHESSPGTSAILSSNQKLI
jgi:hypothetical protein